MVMKENDIKAIWMNAHKKNQAIMENPDTIRTLMKKSHCHIITKITNEFKLKIAVFSVSLLAIVGIMVYAFVFLKLSFPLSGILSLIVCSLFLAFMLISEIMRFIFFKSQDDNKSIKDSTINYRTRLKRIKSFDFYSILILCYGIACLFAFGYLFNFVGIKDFFQSAELSGLLITFILLLLIVPWLMKSSINKRYSKFDISLKSTMDYFGNEVS